MGSHDDEPVIEGEPNGGAPVKPPVAPAEPARAAEAPAPAAPAAGDESTRPRPIEAVVAAVGIVGAVITLASLPVNSVFASHPVRSILVGLAFAALALCLYWLWRGVALGRSIEGSSRIAIGGLSVVLALVGWGALAPLMSGAGGSVAMTSDSLISVPKAMAATNADDGVVPYGTTNADDPTSYDAGTAPAAQDGALRIRYYLVSDPQFVRALFDKRFTLGVEGAAPAPRSSMTDDADQGFLSLLDTLLNPKNSAVLQNEPYRYMTMVWSKYLSKREPAGKLATAFTALEAQPTQVKISKGTWDESEKVLWVEANNRSLMAGGWFDLDPLTKVLAKSNPSWPAPLAKAGALQWKNYSACGDEKILENGPAIVESAFIVPRKVKFLLLDVENVSQAPIGSIALNQNGRAVSEGDYLKLLTAAQARSEIARAPYSEFVLPNTTLRPGEHLVVPLAVGVGEFDDVYDYEPGKATPIAYFGPSVHVRGIRYESGGAAADQAVSDFDEAKLTRLAAGLEGGASCPVVCFRSGPGSPWVAAGHVLVGANSVLKRRESGRAFAGFDGTVLVREEEWETTHLMRAWVQGTDPSGRRVEVQAAGRFPVVLDRGQEAVLSFPGSEVLRNVSVVVDGYYVPYARSRGVPIQAPNHGD